jgi:hypothetical protein
MTSTPDSGACDAANPPQATRIWRPMERMFRQRRAREAFCVALLASAPTHANDGWFVTARGHRVETPAIGVLDCAGIERVLARIDATGYRKGKRLPYDRADMALFEYEHRLAEAHFARCGHDNTPPSPSSDGNSRDHDAFGGGYE